MITVTKKENEKIVGNDSIAQVELAGLSTDTKPTSGIANGSTYIEMDTGKVYFFDQENNSWKEI